MLGKLCAECLGKYVLRPFLGIQRRGDMFASISMEMGYCARLCYLSIAFCGVVTHN
jgi:hypothetical protein